MLTALKNYLFHLRSELVSARARRPCDCVCQQATRIYVRRRQWKNEDTQAKHELKVIHKHGTEYCLFSSHLFRFVQRTVEYPKDSIELQLAKYESEIVKKNFGDKPIINHGRWWLTITGQSEDAWKKKSAALKRIQFSALNPTHNKSYGTRCE